MNINSDENAREIVHSDKSDDDAIQDPPDIEQRPLQITQTPIRSNPRASILEKRHDIFIHRPNKELDEITRRRGYKVLLHMTFTPIILAFIVILVPLAGFKPSNSQLFFDDTNSVTNKQQIHALINPWSYIVFQLVYNIIAFPCLVMPLFFPFYNILPNIYTWYVLPWICVSGGVFMIYYFQIIHDPVGSLEARGVVYLYGVLYNFVAIWISYFFACMLQSFKEAKVAKEADNAGQKVVEKETVVRAVRRMSQIGQIVPLPPAGASMNAAPKSPGPAGSSTKLSKVGSENMSNIVDEKFVLIDHSKLFFFVLILSMLHAGGWVHILR